MKYNKDLQNKININLINYIFYSGRYIKHGENGIIKEYNYDTKLIYEGQYLKGKRNGKGKEYNLEGNLIFEGEYLNGRRWNGKGYFDQEIYQIKGGRGSMEEYINDNGLIFQGEYLNGLKHGKGKEYTINENSIEIKFGGEYIFGRK